MKIEQMTLRSGGVVKMFGVMFTLMAAFGEPLADDESLVFFNRTGVGLFFSNAQLREKVYNGAGLNFQLPGQFVDTDFTHTLDVC